MALVIIEDFEQNYSNTIGENNIINFNVYADVSDEKIGIIKDILVDEYSGKFRYLIVDIGFWIFGKKVLLPIGIARISFSEQRVYAKGMTKEQAKNLPEFNDDLKIDDNYEQQVRNVYRPSVSDPLVKPVAPVAPVDPIELNTVATLNEPSEFATPGLHSDLDSRATYDQNTYKYQNEPDLYELNDTDRQSLKLYEERLVANKKRVKSGEVTIGKHVETRKSRISVPLEKERVVVERVTPADVGTPVDSEEANFRKGEVVKMEVYQETPDIRKQAVLREEVRIRKEVEQDTVEAEEKIRREELDIDGEKGTLDDRR
ncbi:MAG TPA: photosystem reaction center subunit H [Cyanobacteria bacterium UBA11049]|nr:photosystem reaction center subunit H [Cyanobacteria bacterium UBA11049]